ncbi:hypothetical protein D3C75_1249690 [compost metagenome]
MRNSRMTIGPSTIPTIPVMIVNSTDTCGSPFNVSERSIASGVVTECGSRLRTVPASICAMAVRSKVVPRESRIPLPMPISIAFLCFHNSPE